MPIAKAYTPLGWRASDIESPRVWNGTSWVFPTTRIWDGSGWMRNIGIRETSFSISSLDQSGAGASAIINLNTNKILSNDVDARTWPWITSTAATPTGYQALVTLVSGSLDVSSGVGTWVDITATLSWGVYALFTSSSAVINLQIRKNGGATSAATQIFLDAASGFVGP